ncbi:MAG: hypothetical protein AAF211_12250, partial [Myxococcota bacterium]
SDPFGLLVREVVYSAPGPDGQWFTTDDAVNNWQRASDEGEGVRWIRDFTESGIDGTWLTDDDVYRTYLRQTFDNDGAVLQLALLDTGPDGIPGSTDDTPRNVQELVVSEAGFTLEAETYTGPGPDGEWDTNDDELTFTETYLTPRPAGPGTSTP